MGRKISLPESLEITIAYPIHVHYPMRSRGGLTNCLSGRDSLAMPSLRNSWRSCDGKEGWPESLYWLLNTSGSGHAMVDP